MHLRTTVLSLIHNWPHQRQIGRIGKEGKPTIMLKGSTSYERASHCGMFRHSRTFSVPFLQNVSSLHLLGLHDIKFESDAVFKLGDKFR